MYQLKSRKTGDTWWVFSKDEVEYAVQRWGEQYLGVLGFILTEPQPNTKPLHRLKSRKTGDTWYAFSDEEVNYAKRKWREIYGGIDGYIYENAPSDIKTKPM